MAFHLEPHERVPEGLERVAREELRAALAELDGTTGPVGDEGVHEARKRIKRVRALLRLVRSGMDKSRRREENSRLRDAGREIAALRDGRVLLDTAQGLADGDAALLAPEALAGLHEVLRGRYRAARTEAYAGGGGVRAAAGLLAAAVDAPPWDVADDADLVADGLHRSAARAADAHEDARAEPDAERLHTWRKRVKDLRHQVEVLVPAWPPVLGAWAEELHRLTDHLGDGHDLDALAAAVAEVPEAFRTPADHAALLDVISHRRTACARAAFDLGARVHAEDPGGFADRVGAYVAAWSAAEGS